MNHSRRKFILNSGKALTLTSLVSTATLGRELFQKFGPNDTVNIGVIGTGGRGSWLIKLISDLEGINVTACCDILPFRLEKGLALASPGAKGYTEYQKLLENKDLDAVIVSTPLSLHYEIADAALKAGKHVYCEKTMVFTIEQVKALEKTYKNSGRLFQVGYQHRYNLLYQWVKDFVNSEKFGKLSHIENYWNRNSDWRRSVPSPELERMINWRLYREYSGGLMAELSSHQLDIIDWIVEDHPVKVTGFGGIDYWKDGRETFDNIHTIFEFENGLKANFSCLTSNAQMGYQMKFYGSKATIQVKGAQSHRAYLYLEPEALDDQEISNGLDAVSGATKKVLQSGEPVEIKLDDEGYKNDMPTSKALASFADCIRNNKEPLVSFEYGKQGSIEVVMANKAMRNGTVEHWDENA